MLANQKIVIAGGSGFIGSAMASRWSGSNEVVVLSRGSKTGNNSYGVVSPGRRSKVVHWNGKTPGPWMAELEGADLLINLAGRSVNCRYNAANKAEILTSRTDSTQALGEAVQQCVRPPKLWINGGSATIYPHATDTPRDESFTAFADDFSVQVCKAWEKTFFEQSVSHTRQIALRIAIVLGHGGVMIPFRRLARLGLGGHQGNGKQMFSWIHIDDLCSIVEWIQEHPEADGVYNASAPHAVTNEEFMTSLRQSMHVPLGLPAPEWMLRIGARIIGTEPELLLKSRWVVPARLQGDGYNFRYPDVKSALCGLLQ